MSKLFVIVGGAVVIALFAALIGPRFVNWNDYKATFEAEAEKIVGRPVRVIGSASATLLPSPSLTFEEVSVGEADGEPMMTVDRFAVTIELMPLLQGEFRIIAMRLDRPYMRIVVGDDGRLDWQARNEASKALDPEKIVLERLEVADGHLVYSDRVGETELSFDGINAVVEARSLLGPWRVEGSYLDDGMAVPFRFATGRRLDDGTIRVKTDLSPAGWPVALTADGVVGSGDGGLFYDGTYSITEVMTAAPQPEVDARPEGDVTGWRSEGKFRLSRRQLAITQAVLSNGPPERPYSVAGSLTVNLGAQPRFEAHASARQINLDRSLGKGPAEPVETTAAARSLVDWLVDSFVPPIPGSVFFNVPAIVVGGAVIQNVAFEARPTIGGWRLASFNASLPGRASLQARGVLATDFEVSFAGDLRLVVNQPALFAAWWQGRSPAGAGRLLAPFAISGRADLAPQQFAFENIDASMGDATVTGRFSWSDSTAREPRRVLQTDLTADSIDFNQMRALVELVAGKDLANAAVLADSYEIRLAAGAFQFDDVIVRDVAIDVGLADDTLTVNEFGLGDLGGASLHVTAGQIESLGEQPRGHLDAQLEAATLTGLTRVVERILPDHAFSRWLRNAGPSLTPAFLTASIQAPPQEGEADLRVNLSGVAASTTLSAAFDVSGSDADWRQRLVGLEIVVDSPDSNELSRQIGMAIGQGGDAGSAHLQINANGLPADGLDARFAGEFAGVGLRSSGRLTFAAGMPPAYIGGLAAASDDVRPLLRMIGLGIPFAAAGNSARIDGEIRLDGPAAEFRLRNSKVADRLVNGRMSLAKGGDNTWSVDGDIHVDAVDFGWLRALGLGIALKPTGDSSAPWSRAPFGEPGYGQASGRIAVATDELALAEDFAAKAASLTLDLQPNRLSLDLAGGQFIGGRLGGGLSIHNVGGNARLTGRIDLEGAALESLVWTRGGRAVASGVVDLSAEFEAAGRSPAAMLSSLTGGGTVAVDDGEVRYMNPQAAQLVIRASDLGQEFTENELRNVFAKQIDGGSFVFDRAEGAFAIAAGVVRVKSVAVDGDGMRMTGSGAIDLARLSIDSDWTVTFDAADDRVEGAAAPQVGIVFRGPLGAPERIIDVVQFGSYLNIRQEARLLEILSQAEADRLEADRLNRERRKLREDAERRARKAAEAEAERIAAEAERQRLAAEAAARRAADEAARIAGEAERQRAVAEAAAEQLAEAHAASEAAAKEAERLEAEAERLRRAAEQAAAEAAKQYAARRAADDALRRAVEAEEAQVVVAAEAADAAAEAKRRHVAAEAAAAAALEAHAARRAAEQEATLALAEAERQARVAEEAAAAAQEQVEARMAAEQAAAETAATADRQMRTAVAAVSRAADRLATLEEAEAAARRSADAAQLMAEDAERRRAAAEEAVEGARAEVARRTIEKQEADRIAAEATEKLHVADRATEAAERLQAEVDEARNAAERADRAHADAVALEASARENLTQLTAEAERLRILALEATGRAGEATTARMAAEERAAVAETTADAGSAFQELATLTAAEEAAHRAADAARSMAEEAEGRRLSAQDNVDQAQAEVEVRTAAKEQADQLKADAIRQLLAADQAADAAPRLRTDVDAAKRAADEAIDALADAEAGLAAAEEEFARLAAEAERPRIAAADASRRADEAAAARDAAAEGEAASRANADAARSAAEQAARLAEDASSARVAAESEAANLAAEVERLRPVVENAAGLAAAAAAATAAAEAEAAALAAEAERLARLADEAGKVAAAEGARHSGAAADVARGASEAESLGRAAEDAARAAADAEAAHEAVEAEAAKQASEAARQAAIAEAAARRATAAEEEAERLAIEAAQQKLVADEATRKALEASVPQ